MRRTREYDANTGMVMKKVARELGIRHASIETQVGYQVAFQKKTRPRKLQNKRAKKTMRTVLRVAQLPPLFSRERKQNRLRSATYPQNIYGTELGPPSKAVKILLEQAIPSVFTHRTNTQRSKHVCFAFLIKGHKGGPVASVAGAVVGSDPPSPATARGVAEIVGTSVECCAQKSDFVQFLWAGCKFGQCCSHHGRYTDRPVVL